jgi:hypothetical protein
LKALDIPKHKFRLTGNYFYGLIILVAIVGSAVLPENAINYLIYVFLFMLGVYIYLTFYYWRRNWREIAAQNGLTFELYNLRKLSFIKWCRLDGGFQGRIIRVDVIQYTPSGKRQGYTRIRLSTNLRENNQLVLTKKSIERDFRTRQKSREQLIQTDVETGDKKFESDILIASYPSNMATNIFENDSIRRMLLIQNNNLKKFRIEIVNNELLYYEAGVITDEKYM